MKIRVTINTDDNAFDGENEDSYTRGVYSMDLEGVYRAFYGSPNYFVNFEDVQILECDHKDGFDKRGKCWDCEMTKDEIFGTEICECGLPKKECDVDA